MELNGKVALVTGGTMGIGAAIALDLAHRGAEIAVAAREQGDAAREVSRRIGELGQRSLSIAAELSRAEDCRRAVAETVAAFGRLDILVHNAGGPAHGRIDEISDELWQEALDLHLSANFHLVRAALPHLRKQAEGAIVTISSTAGLRGVIGAIAYATAKGAVQQFTRCLARELADDNIRVNCVAPGIIRTRFHDDMPEERRRVNLEQRIPLHREGTPEQVAQVVSMLVTNDFLTGETIVVDGGLTSRLA